jgi:hypothetical protein
VDGGVDDAARASNAHLCHGGASPHGGFGNGHDPLPCRLDQGGHGGKQRHRNGDEKYLVHDGLLSSEQPIMTHRCAQG